MSRQIVVVGGGPAGMMAAIAAAERGSDVLLIEKNEKLGKKLYITGKGRCNVTNDCEPEKFLRNIPRNSKFLLSSLSKMDNVKLMRFFEDAGVPLVVERGERVFPASGKASDITRALQRRLERAGVKTRTGDACESLYIEDGALTGVRAQSGFICCDAAIIATGGISYPATGSTGDGYRFAMEAGHSLVEPRASLVPLETAEDWPKTLQGISLKNVELHAAQGKKKLFSERGEMLFTHFGISGPLVLSLSAHLPDKPEDVRVWIDLKPALTDEQISARLMREIESAGSKQLYSVLGTLMPHRLAEVFAAVAGLNGASLANQVTRAQRIVIAQTLKHLPIAIRGFRPIDEAVITRGGVNVREIEPGTMQSKLVRGLYFAGEALDVDGYTGGFNLQIAFSTGYAAGFAAGGAQEEES